MAQEIETRAVVQDSVEITGRLVQLGFTEAAPVEQTDIMLDLPDGSLFRSGQKIRLRDEGGRVELTYKGHFRGDDNFSRRIEIDVPLVANQVGPLQDLLGALGYPELFRIRKLRSKLTRGDLQVTFDRWPIIGCLMEVEGEEHAVTQLIRQVCPTVEFRNFRLKELFEAAAQARGMSVSELQAEYEEAEGESLGRLDLMLA